MLPYLSAILALIIAGLLQGKQGLTGTALVLLVNFALANGFYAATGDSHAWMLYLIIDYLSAISVLIFRSERWPLLIAIIYGFQILCHGAYGLSTQDAWTKYEYWWTMFYSGYAQLIVLGAWAGHGFYRRYSGSFSLPQTAQLVLAKLRK